jgi:hypothetical protein
VADDEDDGVDVYELGDIAVEIVGNPLPEVKLI